MRYQGGCHCGAVRYEAELDLDKPVITCNCSHCGKKGFVLSFIPAAQFTQTAGEGALTEYRFNTRAIEHLFCKTCGVESFARGKGPGGADTACVNVRCLDDIDLTALDIQPFDGASL